MDLADLDTLPHKIDRLLALTIRCARDSNWMRSTARESLRELTALAPQLRLTTERYGGCSIKSAARASVSCSRGAQGALLDVDHGTYPYVTSSNTVAAQAATGTGMGPSAVGYVLGICKAYTTRVARALFRPNCTMRSARRSAAAGKEFGVNTGRKRRCGWFDAALVRQTVRTCGINGLALTKLDILDGFDTIEVCTGYMLDGKEIDHLPAGEGAQARVVPVYEPSRAGQEPTANAVPGRFAGAGDKNCPPGRGTGGLSDRLSFHQPGTRGYYFGPNPFEA